MEALACRSLGLEHHGVIPSWSWKNTSHEPTIEAQDIPDHHSDDKKSRVRTFRISSLLSQEPITGLRASKVIPNCHFLDGIRATHR